MALIVTSSREAGQVWIGIVFCTYLSLLTHGDVSEHGNTASLDFDMALCCVVFSGSLTFL